MLTDTHEEITTVGFVISMFKMYYLYSQKACTIFPGTLQCILETCYTIYQKKALEEFALILKYS